MYKWGYDRKAKKVSFTKVNSISDRGKPNIYSFYWSYILIVPLYLYSNIDVKLPSNILSWTVDETDPFRPVDYNTLVTDLVSSDFSEDLSSKDQLEENQIDFTYFSSENGPNSKNISESTPKEIFDYLDVKPFNFEREEFSFHF